MKSTHHLPAPSGLYALTGPALNREFYCKYYASHHIVLRPLSITTDLPVIYRWAWPTTHAANMVAATYLYTHESNFARSFIALRDNVTPVAQIDIYHAAEDEVSDDYNAGINDYIIRLLVNPNEKRCSELQHHLLQVCMEYFFLFPEIEKLLVEADIEDSWYQKVIQKTGFTLQKEVYLSYRKMNLYCCTRNHFIETAGWQVSER
jgi:hypothetical protein